MFMKHKYLLIGLMAVVALAFSAAFAVVGATDGPYDKNLNLVCWNGNPNGNSTQWVISAPIAEGMVRFDWTTYVGNTIDQSAERQSNPAPFAYTGNLADRMDVRFYTINNFGDEVAELGKATAFATEEYRCGSDAPEVVEEAITPAWPAEGADVYVDIVTDPVEAEVGDIVNVEVKFGNNGTETLQWSHLDCGAFSSQGDFYTFLEDGIVTPSEEYWLNPTGNQVTFPQNFGGRTQSGYNLQPGEHLTAIFPIQLDKSTEPPNTQFGAHMHCAIKVPGNAEGWGTLEVVDDVSKIYVTQQAAPTCDGKTATIWVNSADIIVGGPDDGKPYNGKLPGTDGFDVIVGTDFDDRIDAGKGNDTVCGLGGGDKIFGGGGLDNIFGGEGNDRIVGGGGNDRIYGEGGDDTIFGEQGNDRIWGGNGNDKLYGRGGNDEIWGGFGDDTIRGDEGNDVLRGENGRDNIRGDDGNDTINGGQNPDTLFGNQGDDFIEGANGFDTVDGGQGTDECRSAEDQRRCEL